jgi:glycosyltransferase involved in cell wall biosynthesis
MLLRGRNGETISSPAYRKAAEYFASFCDHWQCIIIPGFLRTRQIYVIICMIINEEKSLAATSNGHISIIIVTYNAAAYLQKCLDSIYAQQYPAISIIIIDGASTDGTVQILENNNARIHFWRSEKDDGIYDSMNKALKHINGKWVYFLGADDELLPAFSGFAGQMNNPQVIYYANVLHNGIKRSGLVSPYYMAKVGIYHQAIIYPAQVFTQYTYNTRYKVAADYALNMRLYKDGRYKFEYRDLIIANYNHTGVSATIIDEVFEKEKASLIRQNFGLKIWLRYMFRLIKAKLGLGKKQAI